MRKRSVFFCIIATVITFFVSCANNDNGDDFGSISGKVTERVSGAAISSANVILSPGGANKQTDNDGFYEFKMLEPGDYSVTVQCVGYRADNSIITVRPGEGVSVNFSLVEGGN